MVKKASEVRPGFVRGSVLAEDFGLTRHAIALYLRDIEHYQQTGHVREHCYEEEAARRILREREEAIQRNLLKHGRDPSKRKNELPPLELFKAVAQEFRQRQDSFWG